MQKRILYVIAPERFRDEEYLEPTAYFLDKGYEVDTVSTQCGLAKGMFGAEVQVNKTVDDVTSDNYDALVIAGGMGSPDYLWGSETLKQHVQDFVAAQKVVCAICISGVVLAKAGVLTGKKATVWLCDASEQAYQEHGVVLVKELVVTDGLFVTADGPEASLEFAQAIDAVLSKNPSAV